MKFEQSDYYDFSKVLSRNAVYNFVVGGRGIGKTYGAVKDAISAYIKRGDEFVYLRRYKEELATARANFFAEVQHEFPEYQFRINGSKGEVTNDGKHWHVVVHFVALSTTQANKSVAYPRVTRIIFDEFIIEKGAVRYITNEVNTFNSFYSTVDRWKDKTRVLFLANAVQLSNPYFIEYGIRPHSEFSRYANGFICAHFVDSADFMSKAVKTRFGQFISDTAYADYAMGNEFADNTESLIGRKTPAANYAFTMIFDSGSVSFWYDIDARIWYGTATHPAAPVRATLRAKYIDDGTTLLVNSDKILQTVRTAFRRGRMLFDEPMTRNIALEIFKGK